MSNPISAKTKATVYPIAYKDPLTVFAALRRADKMSVLLDSAASGPDSGRYSIVATDPVIIVAEDWRHAFERLRQVFDALPVIDSVPEWPLGPGLFGSFGYALRHALEQVPGRHAPPDGPTDLIIGLFDMVVVFDIVERRAAIIACDIGPRPDFAQRVDDLRRRIALAHDLPPMDWQGAGRWTADYPPHAYEAQIDRVLDYIRAGDIYQANFTQRWVAPRPSGLDGFTLYRRLRMLSPAPYAAFIDDGKGNAILSASPERFLRLTAERKIDTRPIKGTRPRGKTVEEDLSLAVSLTDSVKDRAENLMIVDLLRNDLGRVAETGSVAVPELNALYSFSSVHHLVSTVTARLKPGLSPLDLICATFPGGSVTGTPKIRAMEIIDQLEGSARGHYCGAIGWIGLDRAMELSIAIRTMILSPDLIVAQAGGGIVADSDPAMEYQEASTKARPMLATLDPSYRDMF